LQSTLGQLKLTAKGGSGEKNRYDSQFGGPAGGGGLVALTIGSFSAAEVSHSMSELTVSPSDAGVAGGDTSSWGYCCSGALGVETVLLPFAKVDNVYFHILQSSFESFDVLFNAPVVDCLSQNAQLTNDHFRVNVISNDMSKTLESLFDFVLTGPHNASYTIIVKSNMLPLLSDSLLQVYVGSSLKSNICQFNGHDVITWQSKLTIIPNVRLQMTALASNLVEMEFSEVVVNCRTNSSYLYQNDLTLTSPNSAMVISEWSSYIRHGMSVVQFQVVSKSASRIKRIMLNTKPNRLCSLSTGFPILSTAASTRLSYFTPTFGYERGNTLLKFFLNYGKVS